MPFASVVSAAGRVPDAVFMKAARYKGIPDAAYGIAGKVFVKGHRQAAVARQEGVPRQKVHAVCVDLLDTINKLMGRAKSK